ncbi:facilitated trehalose transporter Tret1-like [Anopheles bellator]|uniref:facilitated trehalose transporter Tret1-like n=1 Tax=Anopheles bellator TaxID=139047 RepID=UPI002647E2E1|nr:facilitated trehalose transporter Tret1-like [Anopheles bellator]
MARIGVLRQYLATISVNLLGVGYGTVSGWTSSALPTLQSPDGSPLGTGPITQQQASWIGGVLCLGGIVGTLVGGLLVERVGRKWAAWLAGWTLVAGWVLVIVADRPGYLMGTRFLGGFAGGVQYVATPLYVPEIAETRIRGALGSLLVLSCCVGVQLAYLTGALLPYATIPWICLSVPVVFLAGFAFIPESPYYLSKMQQHQAAEDSLRYFRAVRKDGTVLTTSDGFERELSQLRSLQSDPKGTKPHDPLRWADFNTNHARRAFLICLVLMALNQFCGCFYMMNYAESVFANSGAGFGLPARYSVIVVGLIQLCGCYTSTLLVDRTGRKLLLVISCTGVALGQTVFAAYCYGQAVMGYDLTMVAWLPLVCFSVVIFVGSLGVLSLPFVVLGEIMPQKIKGFATTFCMTINWTFAFVALKYFSAIGIVFGMHGLLCVFAICSLVGAVFAAYVIPETKGKDFDEIRTMMDK